MFEDLKASARGLLGVAAVVAIACGAGGPAAAKGKPTAIEPVEVNLTGGLMAARPVESYDVSIKGGKNAPVLEIVVRNFDVTFVFGRDSESAGFSACFDASDAGAAGRFLLDDNGDAVLEIYPEFLDKKSDPQQYQFILTGSHDYVPSVANFPASNGVSITADFMSVQVSAEGRGKQRDACTGSFDFPTDGFGATATFAR